MIGPAKKDVQLVVRVPEELARRLDEVADRLRAEHPGPAWHRSDVVRYLLERGLGQEPRGGLGAGRKRRG